MGTGIWISINFHKSQNTIFLLFFDLLKKVQLAGYRKAGCGPERAPADPALNQRSSCSQKRSNEQQWATKQGCGFFLDSVLVLLILETFLDHPPPPTPAVGGCPTFVFSRKLTPISILSLTIIYPVDYSIVCISPNQEQGCFYFESTFLADMMLKKSKIKSGEGWEGK